MAAGDEHSDPTRSVGQFDAQPTEVIRPGDERTRPTDAVAPSTELIGPGAESTRLVEQAETRMFEQPETRQFGSSPFPAGGPAGPRPGQPDPYPAPHPTTPAPPTPDPYAATPYPSVDPYHTTDPSAAQVSQAYGAAAPPPALPPGPSGQPTIGPGYGAGFGPPAYGPPAQAGYAPPPTYYPAPPVYSYGVPPGSVGQANGSAIGVTIASGVTLLSCCNVFGVVSLIMGIVALSKQNTDPAGSRSMAKAAWWVFGISMLLIVIGAIVYFVLLFLGLLASSSTSSYDSTY